MGALCVSRIVVVMLEIRMFSEVHAICHCSSVKWLLLLSSCVSSFIWVELPSKNLMWIFLSFSCSMGFSLLGVGLGVGSDVLAFNMFGGNCSCIDRWSKFRWIFWFVVEVYWLLLGVFRSFYYEGEVDIVVDHIRGLSCHSHNVK